MAKYLTEEQINQFIGDLQYTPDFKTLSQDTYNEEMIAMKIAKLPNKLDLLFSATNLAIVGFGNQKYGNFLYKDNAIQITKVFQQADIKFSNPKSALLKEDDLTPSRLCRFFRHKIRNYIATTSIEPYLWRKYSTKDKKYMSVCFRGAEYLETLSHDAAVYLLETVKRMDAKNQTEIAERVERVLHAKGVLMF